MSDCALQVVLIEASAHLWAASLSATNGSVVERGLGELVHTVACYIEAVRMLHRHNAVVVLACSASESRLVFDSRQSDQPAHTSLRDLLPAMVERDAQLLESLNAASYDTLPLSGALSQALCACSRELDTANPSSALGHEEGVPSSNTTSSSDDQASGACMYTRKPRVLCIAGSADPTEQYVPVMNCLFSAQRLGARVDSLRIASVDSPFLQQAAHLTGGAYVRPRKPESVLQHMIARFAPDDVSSKQLRRILPPAVDFRASCFCHKRPVDIGRVCSACLSIFCEDVSECSTCGTQFSSQSV